MAYGGKFVNNFFSQKKLFLFLMPNSLQTAPKCTTIRQKTSPRKARAERRNDMKKSKFRQAWCAIVLAVLMLGLVPVAQVQAQTYDSIYDASYTYTEVAPRIKPIWPGRCTGSYCSC